MKVMSEYDEKSILETSVFDELFKIEDECDRADMLVALRDRAEELGKKCLRDFKSKYAAYLERKKRLDQEKKSRATAEIPDQMTQFSYFDDGKELRSGRWAAGMDGVWLMKDYNERIACYHPILITQLLKNIETKKQKVKLAYHVAGEWSEIVVDKGLISSASKITALAEYGINATSENAKDLVRYLMDLENLNPDLIERKISTSKLGWVGGEFIPYGLDVEFDSKERFSELYESVEETGDYNAWMSCIKTVRRSGRKEPLVYLAASFASILLEMLNLPSFVVNLWEETGKGKTVSMMVAASVWGNPKVGKFITDVSSTGTSMEVRSDVLNNLPLFVDDLSKLKESYKDQFTDLIYAWCSGKGKDRSDQNLGMRKSCTWNNITMTSFERPLATENMRGGAINRILDFQMEPGAVFTKETGNATVSVITKNYGFGGKIFVQLVKEMGAKKIRELQQAWLEVIDKWCRDNNEQKEDKQKLPLSILMAADQMIEQNIFHDGINLDFLWCVKQLKGADDVSENQRAYDAIMDEVMIHATNFWGGSVTGNGSDSISFNSGEFWGSIKAGYVYIVPKKFDEIAERNNFSSRAFTRWADSKGLLLHDKDKFQKTARLLTFSAQKYYAIKAREEQEE